MVDRDGALGLSPDRRQDEFRLHRAMTLTRLGDHTAATAEAEAVSGPSATAANLDNAARTCVVALGLVSTTRDGPAADPRELADRYASRALALLDLADRLGFFEKSGAFDRLDGDPDLDLLRRRSDFLAWIEKLKQEPGAGEK